MSINRFIDCYENKDVTTEYDAGHIVFDDGEIIDCDHISKIYIEEGDMENLTIVGCIPKGGNHDGESDA